MAGSKKMVLVGGLSLCACVCVIAVVVAAVLLFMNQGGGDGSERQFTDCKDSYAMVCPVDHVWGEGDAKDMCCPEGRDKTNASNCSAAEKLTQVVLYKDEDYKVEIAQLSPGHYVDMSVVSPGKVWNDDVTSVRVPPNHKVELFYDSNFGGKESKIITASTRNLGDWNDRVSSLKVSKTC